LTNRRYPELLVDRLLGLMAGWWAGRTLAEMGREYGISRQRVGAILKTVGCTALLRRRARDGWLDSLRGAAPGEVLEARRELARRCAHRLSPRQRAALAWRAQGLILADIARRMGVSFQSARETLTRARWRLQGFPRGPDEIPLESDPLPGARRQDGATGPGSTTERRGRP
jgi:hypothetical protein